MQDTSDTRSTAQLTEQFDLRLRATVGERDQFGFHTADGVSSSESFRTPELRLLDALTDDPPESLLVPDANYGVVGVVMGAFTDDVWMTEQSARAARLCRLNSKHNRVNDSTSVAITPDPQSLPASFDVAALAPTGYTPANVVEQRMADAVSALQDGGELYLAAAPHTGLTRYEQTLHELCDDVTTVDDRGEFTVVRGTRLSPFDPPRYAEPRTIQPTIDDTTLSLVTFPGLFSPTKLDDGTRILAESIDITDGETVLDLACGYGPLGIYATLTADCSVWLTDDNYVATACTRRSAVESGVENSLDVITADGVTGVKDMSFNRIVCNPPTHAGSSVLHSLVRGASQILVEDGQLNLVHHQGVSFDQYLENEFSTISSIKRNNYKIVTASF